MSSDSQSKPIDLARQSDFALGPLTVKPSTLEILRGSEREVLEPRVMQVLVALHHAAPNVVSRDDLIAQCWDGRIVGDDAINRAIGRLRRLAESDNAFTIETIPRVGYRLSAANIVAKPAASDEAQPSSASRRALVLTGAAAIAVAAGGGAWWLVKKQAPVSVTVSSADARGAVLVQRGLEAQLRGGASDRAEALGLMEDATKTAPQLADAWAGLAQIYSSYYRSGSPDKAEAMQLRSRDAIARAFALDPRNALAFRAKSNLLSAHNWLEKERLLRQGLAYHPRDTDLTAALGDRLIEAGRIREGAGLLDRVWARVEPNYTLTWQRIQALWAAGRLPEADATMARGMELFPRASGVWFSRFYVLLYTGRAREALAMLEDVDNRPVGVPESEYPGDALVAKAMISGAKADIDKAAAAMPAFAAMGGGFAENAIEFLSALGRIDEAFAVAEARYFGRGFAIAATRFSQIQGYYTSRDEGRTTPLFQPPTAPMRKDKRFAPMMDGLGLTRYWKDSGVKPDYQVYPE